MTERVIFDCDNTMGQPYREVDDGLTLLYLLGRSDVELLGITTTFGNGWTFPWQVLGVAGSTGQQDSGWPFPWQVLGVADSTGQQAPGWP